MQLLAAKILLFSAAGLLFAPGPGSAMLPNVFLEVLFSESDKIGDGYRIDVAGGLRRVPAFVKNFGKVICGRGLWGLYTKENFDVTSLVYPASFKDRECITTDILKSIQSVRPLAGLTTTFDGCFYYERSYFRGDPMPCPPPVPFAGSIAVYVTDSHKVLCSETVGTENGVACVSGSLPSPEKCVCLNGVESGSYLIPDVTRYPSVNPLPQISGFCFTSDIQICTTYRTPDVLDRRSPFSLNGTYILPPGGGK